MDHYILGVSGLYHDSAAALIKNGDIVAAAQEERFSRVKNDQQFPYQAIDYVLKTCAVTPSDLSALAFYEKPLRKFGRLFETYRAFAPKGLESYLMAMPEWLTGKLFLPKQLKQRLFNGKGQAPPIYYPEHHLSHAAGAFYPSPFDEAAILTVDGVGEWTTASIGYGSGNTIKVLREIRFPHSLGLFYSAFTAYCGFKVNRGEYKLMGLSPYGNPGSDRVRFFKKRILEEMIDLAPDGSFHLNMSYFNYPTGFCMYKETAWQSLFGVPPREEEGALTKDHVNLALAVQLVTEEAIFRLCRTARRLTRSPNLVFSGGVALNCVCNGKLRKQNLFDHIWIQPAAGDAGGALGAALAAWYIAEGKPRSVKTTKDSMNGCYLGPEYGDQAVKQVLDKNNVSYTRYETFDDLCRDVSGHLAQGLVIGWFQGRMEYGPRALGNRSIIADARNETMQKKLNLKIKFRESFRPFAPAVLEEDITEYFQMDGISPYMLFTANVVENRCLEPEKDTEPENILERVNEKRSDIPAVTHVDYSARVQSVSKETNPLFWKLLSVFKEKTRYGVLVNTSFNVRGEPIVCSPEDALQCFLKTEMDALVMGMYLVRKEQ